MDPCEQLNELMLDPEFKDYLKKDGSWGAINNAMIALYEEGEWPEDPVQYICNRLGIPRGESEVVAKLEVAPPRLAILAQWRIERELALQTSDSEVAANSETLSTACEPEVTIDSIMGNDVDFQGSILSSEPPRATSPDTDEFEDASEK